MANDNYRLTERAKEYVSSYMENLRIIAKTFLVASAERGKDSAQAQLLRLKKLIERMDSNNFETQDKKFITETQAILIPSFEQALRSFNHGDWFIARQLIEDAIIDILTIESVTLGRQNV